MFARTSTWTGPSDVLARWAEHVAEHVQPLVRGAAGNTGAVFLVDRANGRALTLTLWESEEAALASDELAEQSRQKTIKATGIELVDRGRYEVVARV